MRVKILIRRRAPKKLVARSSQRSAQMSLIIFLTALVGTLYALLGDSGLMSVMRMRARAVQLQYQIVVKQQENQQLRDTIRPLREKDPEAIERLAREQLFMARPGDTIYVLPPEPRPQVPAPADSGEPGSPTAPARLSRH